MVPPDGLEPPWDDYKSPILAAILKGHILAVPRGIEPLFIAWQAIVITIGPWNQMEWETGLEPATVCLEGRDSTNWATPTYFSGSPILPRTSIRIFKRAAIPCLNFFIAIVEPRSLLVLFLQQTGLGQPYNLSESHPVNPCRFYITIAIVGSHVSPKVPSPNINGVFCSAIIIKNHCLSTLSLRATYVKTHLNFGRNYYWHSYYLSSTKLSLSVRRLQRASYILVFFLIDKSIILYFFTKNQVLFFQNSINCVRRNGIFI